MFIVTLQTYSMWEDEVIKEAYGPYNSIPEAQFAIQTYLIEKFNDEFVFQDADDPIEQEDYQEQLNDLRELMTFNSTTDDYLELDEGQTVFEIKRLTPLEN